MKNKMMEKITNGENVIGTFVELGNMNAVEALTGTGLDFIIIDGEHGQSDTETIVDLIRASELTDLTPIVRIADVSHREIQRVLDSGAQGLIVPCLRKMEEIDSLIDLSKYSPVGVRGFAPTRGTRWAAADWAKGSLENTMEISNREALLIPQCETVELLEIIDEVAKKDGVDGIFIGPYDLSISMGMPGQFNNPDFLAAVDKIIKAVKAAGKFLMIYANTPSEVKTNYAKGIEGVAIAMDTVILNNAYRKLVEEIKSNN
ncbi:MAG: aldolase/citrate lyase family protein [Clostridiaceae bacterium]